MRDHHRTKFGLIWIKESNPLGEIGLRKLTACFIEFVIFRNFLEQYKYDMLLDCTLESLQPFRDFVSRGFIQTLINLMQLLNFWVPIGLVN